MYSSTIDEEAQGGRKIPISKRRQNNSSFDSSVEVLIRASSVSFLCYGPHHNLTVKK